VVYAMPTSASLGRPDVVTGPDTSGSECYNSQFVPRG